MGHAEADARRSRERRGGAELPMPDAEEQVAPLAERERRAGRSQRTSSSAAAAPPALHIEALLQPLVDEVARLQARCRAPCGWRAQR